MRPSPAKGSIFSNLGCSALRLKFQPPLSTPIWLPMSWSLPTRKTTIADATEISSAGICATRASPTDSST